MALIKGTSEDDNDLRVPPEGNPMLIGTPDDDDLHGLSGDDIINGLAGNDLAKGGRGDDQIFDTAGNDKLLGGQGDDRLYGGDGDDILRGGEGDDLLVGGRGKDTLIGGAGQDLFGITSRKEGRDRFSKQKQVDVFRDFSAVEDRIVVFKEGFKGGLTEGDLKASQFVIGVAAVDKRDRFIYNPLTGSLFFDIDGRGGRKKMEIAQLPSGFLLSHQNIVVSDIL